MGAWVTVMDINIATLREIGKMYNEKVNTKISTRYNIEKLLPEIDLLLNCVKWPKDSKEFLIDRSMVRKMQKGSVIVDISNDYGVIETFRETTLDNPRYIEEGVVHYCVSNLPSTISQTTSVAYAASVLPHIRNIMNLGIEEALNMGILSLVPAIMIMTIAMGTYIAMKSAKTMGTADHIDHVKTQLPYALLCGGVALVGYLLLGFMGI